ncbi:MAG: hypothetical protein M3P53_08325, partial [Actinomycetota bacterium]|nr:hypothetical protein [Actinomycetota bacterium]
TLPASSHICRSVSRPCRATRTAGVTLLEHDRPKTFAYTNGEAAEVDELQYDEGDGPCLTAYRQQEVIRVESNRTEELAGVLPPSPAARRPAPSRIAACAGHGCRGERCARHHQRLDGP